MTTQDNRLKTAYEVENMTPEDIASDENLNVIAVKSKLMEISLKYRKDCKMEPLGEDRLNFTDADLEAVNKVILETALAAETSDGTIDYKTRLQAAIYVRDDKKGRKEVIKLMQNNQFNIFDMNEKLAEARLKASKAKELIEV